MGFTTKKQNETNKVMDGGEIPNSSVNLPTLYHLEDKPKARLGHQLGEGSLCLKCDCPGLDLHFWRKICKNCNHKMDDHDILPEEDHGRLIIGRLFDFMANYEQQVQRSLSQEAGGPGANAEMIGLKKKKKRKRGSGEGGEGGEDGEDDNDLTSGEEGDEEFTLQSPAPAMMKKSLPIPQYNVTIENGSEKNAVVEYTWVPTNDTLLVEKYFLALPEEERPISGTAGALDRRQKLQYQLPYHDSNVAAARSLKTDEDVELHTKFIKTIKEKVVGVGQLVEWTETVRKLHSDEDESQIYGVCRTCRIPMKAGEVGIITDHGAKNEIWHPNCFRCITCQQRLVDMLYFYKDGEYYCGRHFGDTMYPRCAGCDELIFSKEYTFAESKNWHFDHFCCFGCDRQLGGHRYMVREDQPFCFDCYMKKFAKSCETCRSKIAPDQQRISYRDFHWHADGKCFQCKMCHKVLLNQKFIIKNTKVFCSPNCKNAYFTGRIAMAH